MKPQLRWLQGLVNCHQRPRQTSSYCVECKRRRNKEDARRYRDRIQASIQEKDAEIARLRAELARLTEENSQLNGQIQNMIHFGL
jgi:cell division protein FtsB